MTPMLSCSISISIATAALGLLALPATAHAGTVRVLLEDTTLAELDQAWADAMLAGTFSSSVGSGIVASPSGLVIEPVYANYHWINLLRLSNACFAGTDESLRIRQSVVDFTNQDGSLSIQQVMTLRDPTVGASPFIQLLRLWGGLPGAQTTQAWVESTSVSPLQRTWADLGLAPVPPLQMELEYDQPNAQLIGRWLDADGSLLASHTEPLQLATVELDAFQAISGLFSHQPPNAGGEANPNTVGPNDGVTLEWFEIESSCLPDRAVGGEPGDRLDYLRQLIENADVTGFKNDNESTRDAMLNKVDSVEKKLDDLCNAANKLESDLQGKASSWIDDDDLAAQLESIIGALITDYRMEGSC